jgi:hypothetical protein
MNQPIIDTHVHIWDIERINYPWLVDVPPLNRSFTIEDYRAATKNFTIEKMVFVQCEADFAQYRDEVEFVSAVAREQEPRIRGIVAWAPLEKGKAAREDLEWLKQNPLVKGVRRIIQFEPDLEFCLRPDFVAGVRLLAEYGLTFDICIDWRHYESTLKFVDSSIHGATSFGAWPASRMSAASSPPSPRKPTRRNGPSMTCAPTSTTSSTASGSTDSSSEATGPSSPWPPPTTERSKPCKPCSRKHPPRTRPSSSTTTRRGFTGCEGEGPEVYTRPVRMLLKKGLVPLGII